MTSKEMIEYAGEDVLDDAIADLHAEIAQLRAELAKAKKDGDRLDWVIKYLGRVYQPIYRQYTCEWVDDGIEKETLNQHPTPREAIDAAIQQQTASAA